MIPIANLGNYLSMDSLTFQVTYVEGNRLRLELTDPKSNVLVVLEKLARDIRPWTGPVLVDSGFPTGLGGSGGSDDWSQSSWSPMILSASAADGAAMLDRPSCGGKECLATGMTACTRRHPDCGHLCGGYWGEPVHLPCLELDCASSGRKKLLQDRDSVCGVCMVDELGVAPAHMLGFVLSSLFSVFCSLFPFLLGLHILVIMVVDVELINCSMNLPVFRVSCFSPHTAVDTSSTGAASRNAWGDAGMGSGSSFPISNARSATPTFRALGCRPS